MLIKGGNDKRHPLSGKKTWYQKWWIWSIALAIIIVVPFAINESYKIGKGYQTLWDARDVLSFYGTLLTFIGTVALGVLALWQNKRFKDENDKSQKRFEDINNRLLAINLEKEKRNILELYFRYMEENQKIFNPHYVLQEIQIEHNVDDIYFRLKDAEINATAIKRRLIFFDPEGSGDSFFEYCSKRSEEIRKIVMQKNKKTNEIIHDIFQFCYSYSEEFEKLSLVFINNANCRINKEAPTHDKT